MKQEPAYTSQQLKSGTRSNQFIWLFVLETLIAAETKVLVITLYSLAPERASKFLFFQSKT